MLRVARFVGGLCMGLATIVAAGGVVTAADAPAGAPGRKPAGPGKDWSKHQGALKFVVGYDAGMDAGWKAKQPLMVFFTSAKDRWCPLFAQRTFTDKGFLESVAGYVPVLVDADEDKARWKELTVVELVPALVWVDLDGSTIFSAVGDLPLEMARIAGDTAKHRLPDVAKSEDVVAVTAALDAIHAALADGPIKPAVRAIHELGLRTSPSFAKAEAVAADAELTQRGRARLDAAKALAEAGKKDEAIAAYEAIRRDYGDHPVGRDAAAARKAAAGGA